jgi:hypothetical protein
MNLKIGCERLPANPSRESGAALPPNRPERQRSGSVTVIGEKTVTVGLLLYHVSPNELMRFFLHLRQLPAVQRFPRKLIFRGVPAHFGRADALEKTE